MLKEISKGSTPLYQYNGNQSQDVSGAAFIDGRAYLAFDGGKNAAHPEIRYTPAADIEKPAQKIPLQIIQRDMEGATQLANVLFTTSSLSQVNEDTSDYRVLSAIEFAEDGSIISGKHVFARDSILSALQAQFGNGEWFRRMQVSFGKVGGLNVEGLTVSHDNPNALVFGLRSPLWHESFGSPLLQEGLSLDRGEAILVKVTDPFDDNPQYKVSTIELNGDGIRGMEYVPPLKGYVIISGSVEKKGSFELWLYQPYTDKLIKISTPDDSFHKLCRPESVLHIPESSTVLILSEQSGDACTNVTFNFIRYTY